MVSALMNHPAAATGAIVDLVNSTASRQEVTTKMANQMMEPVVVEVLATVLARMAFVVPNLDFVVRVSYTVRA